MSDVSSMSFGEALGRVQRHLEAGELAPAEALCREMIRQAPNEPQPYLLLATVAFRVGNRQAAAQLIEQSLSIDPNNANAWENLSVLRSMLGDGAGAEVAARRALQYEPRRASAENALGNAVQGQGRLDEAIDAYLRSLAIDPNNQRCWNNLAVVQQSKGRIDEAIEGYRRAIAIAPYGEAYANLGVALRSRGRMAEAVEAGREAVRLLPQFSEGWHNLGVSLYSNGACSEAAAAFRKVLELRPRSVESENYLGACLQTLGLVDQAIECYRLALTWDPASSDAHNNLGLALTQVGRMEEAETSFRQAIALRPDNVEAWNNLGTLFKSEARLTEAMAAFHKSTSLRPSFVIGAQNAVSCAQYIPGETFESLAKIHFDWDRTYAQPLRKEWRPYSNVPDPERRLRLGFISSDFARHPVGFFIVRFLEELNANRFERILYSDRPVADDLTLRIRNAADRWVLSGGLSAEQLTEKIREDRIDILFDLAGHWSGNRLMVFARRPAPIQMSWIGYVGTTGLSAMDGIVADSFHVPAGVEQYFSEEVFRLPNGYVCFDPPIDAPAAAPLPAVRNGYVTFGTISNPAKINDEVVETWSEILHKTPNSRLLLKYQGLADPFLQRLFLDRFQVHGIAADRIEFEGWTDRNDALAAYGRIDVALDPFPYSGGLTTCESLWMGVPVITFPGSTFASRHSYSHLSNAGILESIAENRQAYIELAVRWAMDRPGLGELRASLRERVAKSALCAAGPLTIALETILRDRWRRWTAEDRPTPSTDVPAERPLTIPAALELARQHLEAGRLEEVERTCRAILAVSPNESQAYRHFGIAAHYAGRHDVAAQLLENAVRLAPADAASRDNLSVAYFFLGKHRESEETARACLKIDPDFAAAYINLGNALQAQKRLEEAATAYREAIGRNPEIAEAYSNLGAVSYSLGKTNESLEALEQAVRLRPEYVDALTNLGPTLLALGRTDEAEARQREALRIYPNNPKAYNNLGNVLHAKNEYAAAADAYRKAISVNERYVFAWANLGLSLASLGQLNDAEKAYRRAIELDSANSNAPCNLGLTLQGQGRLQEALASFEDALRKQPDMCSALSNILSCMQYIPGTTLAELAAKHAEWNQRFAAPYRQSWKPFANNREPDRPLRVGFLSQDLGRHPVGHLVVRCLESVDPDQLQVVAYSDRSQEDDDTRRIRRACREWHVVRGDANAELTDRICNDRIDVLFDLAGHTASRRLEVFARRSAPIQISWIGYVGTTGLEAMDYVLADRFHVPPEAELFYREKILRMPDGYICFDPPADAPDIGPLPMLANQHVTFGCFNNSVKINRQVAGLWARILHCVPGSRLMLKALWFEDETTRRRYEQFFVDEGITADRLTFLGNSPRNELLGCYNRIDIALDPFPYSGGITTCEALWMGTPVITCPGQTFASRHSFSHVANAGFGDLVAHDFDDYVERAVQLAGDVDRLAELRRGMRERMLASPLCDGPRFARNFTALLREAWRSWLESPTRMVQGQ